MNDLGKLVKQHRVAAGLTLARLAAASGLSPSHLTRIERGKRFPSASALRRLAKPLGFEEKELFMLAGFLSPLPSGETQKTTQSPVPTLDPYVARVLAQEPVEVQRSVIGILAILKSLATSAARENSQP